MVEPKTDGREWGNIGRACVTPSGAVIWICVLCKPNDFFDFQDQFEAHLKKNHGAEAKTIEGPFTDSRS